MEFPGPKSAEMLAIITEHIGATVSVYDRNLVFRYVSKSFARFFGLTPDQMIGRTLPECYGEDVFAGYWPRIERALAGESQYYERLLVSPSGDQSWRTVSLVPWRNEAGEVVGVVNAAHNVHELKTTSDALRAANQRLMGHMLNSPLALIEFDPSLRLTEWSPRAQAMFGFARDELPEFPLDHLLRHCDDAAGAAPLRTAIDLLRSGSATSNRAQAVHCRPDNVCWHGEWFNSALTSTRGEVTSIMCLVEDVSSRVQAEEQLRYIAEHDSLTGLPNRAALHARVERALVRARRSAECIALLFIDLDGFKAVNDRWGHGAGDAALKEVARRLKEAVRETDTVARLGGDEFVALLEGGVTQETPAAVGERILEVMLPPFHLATGHSDPSVPRVVEARLGASIGIAMHPPLESHVDSLFKRADEAMYQAKRAGKGCLCFATPLQG